MPPWTRSAEKRRRGRKPIREDREFMEGEEHVLSQGDGFGFFPLDESSKEHEPMIAFVNQFFESNPVKGYSVRFIEYIVNVPLEREFAVWKRGGDAETRWLFHCTPSEDSARSIARENFDDAYCGKRAGLVHGRGFYFSPIPRDANLYCFGRYMIICEVLSSQALKKEHFIYLVKRKDFIVPRFLVAFQKIKESSKS